jgi:hypothetical protein
MKTKITMLVLMIGLGLSNANSQDVPEALSSIFRLEGNWQGPATLVLDGNTYNFTYHANFVRSAENTSLYMEESFTHADLGTLKGYNLIGYNVRDERIHWFSVDNFGTTHDHIGYWKSADHFYMETTEKHAGKKFEEMIDIVFIDNDHVSIHFVAKLANVVFEDITVSFIRQSN